MNNIINKFYNIVDKIGKRNIILIIFLLIVIIVAGLYTTFSLYTTTNGTSLVDGIMTYKFILNNSNEESSVTIASGSSKNVAITISNPESMSLKYGLYYSSTDDISSVNIGYLSTSSKLPKGTISGNNNYTVTIKIDNTSSTLVTIKFGIVYGLENGGELSLPSGKNWLDEYVPLEAKNLSYDNTNTGVDCSDIQCMIDELDQIAQESS